MDEKALQNILTLNYGMEYPSLEFLREGGTRTYIVKGKSKYLLKVIGAAFSEGYWRCIFRYGKTVCIYYEIPGGKRIPGT